MSKKLTIILVLCIVFGLEAKNKKNNIITNASYMVFDKQEIGGDIYSPLKQACFYTFDGKLLKRMNCDEYDFSMHVAMTKMVDPNAPKPRPIKFKIVYHDRRRKTEAPGYWIVFYDMNGNILDSSKYIGPCRPTREYISTLTDSTISYRKGINFGQTLDLSIVQQEVEEPWYKIW
ncbi:MAG: hypothetical protein P4L22_06250 [Candidatus Babeliales bacterium]|nr:hypothetical protein [Candidatus Babeliales bacterium]